MAASRRSQAALLCQSQQNRVCRGSVTNRTQGATCRPQVRGRRVAAARSRCDAMDNSVASVAAVLLTKPSARHPAPEGAATCSPLGGGYPRGRGGHGATGAYSQKGCVGRKSLVIKEGHVAASRRPLGSLLHPFLERKGCVRPGMRGCHHLPVEDVALAGSARSQAALRRNG